MKRAAKQGSLSFYWVLGSGQENRFQGGKMAIIWLRSKSRISDSFQGPMKLNFAVLKRRLSCAAKAGAGEFSRSFASARSKRP